MDATSTCFRKTLVAARIVVAFVASVSPMIIYGEDAIGVDAIRVEARPIVEQVPLSGTVYAPQISLVSAQVEGVVQQVYVDAGTDVEAGQILLELDPELMRIARDEAKARLQGAAARRDESKRLLQEARALAEQNNIAPSEVAARQAAAESSVAEYRAAEADYRRTEAELARHLIEAPFGGTVSDKLVAAGEWVTPGTGVVELVDSDHLSVDFQVPQRYYPMVSDSANLELRFDAYPGERFRGEVTRKVPLSRAGARTFLLRGQLVEEGGPSLIPGMAVSAALRVDTGRESVTVPRDALVRHPDGRITVWVIRDPSWNQPSPVREQLVDTGLSSGGWVEITEGLEEGQVVVTRGNEALNEGRQVVPRQADYQDASFY